MVTNKIDQIAPAGMLAKEHHCDSHREWLLKFSAQMHQAGSLEVAWKGEVGGEAVKAFIDYSRWVAACPHCGTVEAVDPEEKLFFCLYCSCEDNSHKARPVEFPEPDVMKRIVRLLLERPVQYMPGPTLYNRIGKAQPAIMLDKHLNEPGAHVQFKLSRSWHYDQTLEELEEEQREALESWRKAVGGQQSETLTLTPSPSPLQGDGKRGVE